MSSPVRGVSRVVSPVATSVSHTLLSITNATCRPSGCQVKQDATGCGLYVTCTASPPLGETVQN